MQNVLDWNKLSNTAKSEISKIEKLVFVPGPVQMSDRRIRELVNEYKSYKILFGCLKDEAIPGLEDSLHFKALDLDSLERAQRYEKDVSILLHFHKDTKNIVKEISPVFVLFINGSWQGPIHYRSEFWKALDVGSRIRLNSPFFGEREAKGYEKEIEKYSSKKYKTLFYKSKKYSDKELLALAKDVSSFSWDWLGQIGAVLARSGKVKAVAWNRVLPYESYQMHFGSIREANQIPSQEMIETQLTNHAESEILEIARRQKINLKKTTLYLNMFPCPICAKNLSRTEIDMIVYSHDHNLGNDIGYKILDISGKKIKRIVI